MDRDIAKQKSPADAGDLQSQLEDLLSAVWNAEANWRFDDRLDLALAANATRRLICRD
jgi:hypothetical protein